MAKFAFLMYERFATKGGWADASEELLAAHGAFAEKVEELGGTLTDGQAYHPTSDARSVRGGEVVDGAFVDSEYGLLSHAVLEARDLDHALEIAKACPIADGGVEVRPLLPV